MAARVAACWPARRAQWPCAAPPLAACPSARPARGCLRGALTPCAGFFFFSSWFHIDRTDRGLLLPCLPVCLQNTVMVQKTAWSAALSLYTGFPMRKSSVWPSAGVRG